MKFNKMKFMRKVYLSGMISFIIIPVSMAQNGAPAGQNFSLQEAINFALENNTNIENANLDITSAKKEVWKTMAIGLPQANGKLDYQYLPGELPSLSFPAQDGGMQEIALGVKNSATYSVTVSQLVFSGEYIVGLQASKTFLELSKNTLDKTEFDTKANIKSSYYTILVLEKNKQILDSTMVNIDKTLRETKALAEQGFLEDTDYEQIQVTKNSIQNSIHAVERQIEISYMLFKISLGLDVEDKVNLTDNLDYFLLELDVERLIDEPFVLDENIEYRILDTQEKISELNVKREKSKFLPSLSAFYMYQDKTNKPDFDVTFNHILGLNVSVPIFSSGQKLASMQQAKIELEKSINTKEQVSDNLKMAVEQAKNDFHTAYEKYLTQLKNIDLAKRIYEKTLVKYKNGVASSLDVTQANNQYLDTNSSYTSAILEMLNAKIELEKALNNL